MRLPSVFNGVLWAVMALLLGSCVSKECYDNQTTIPLAGFYSSGAPTQSVAMDSLEVYAIGVPGDSVLLKPSITQIKELALPFNLDAERTDYVFVNARTQVADTVSFRYKSTPWFASEACGVVFRFEMREITCSGTLIDSVACPAGVITNKPVENLKIYFKPRNH